ncbi:MAG: RNA-binding transcriptional accessory protein [Deltaproteobacteria bacterium]|nr:RNA-binding transcriptional accessory protein [Deltaproteobacteria bacterium]
MAMASPGAARVEVRQVEAVLGLLDDGATVPFIARYRKERTGSLDEVVIRAIATLRDELVELDKRRRAIESALSSDGLLTPELAQRLAQCATRAELEEVYLPFRKKRKTRASVARERGLLPLAELILAQPRHVQPAREAQRFVGPKFPEVPDIEAALAGARDIVAEILTDRPELRTLVRDALRAHGRISSARVKKTTEGKRTAFEDYYEHTERLDRVPSHRYLAMARGESEGFLKVKLEVDDARVLGDLARRVGIDRGSAWATELEKALGDGYERLLFPQIETVMRAFLAERADLEAVAVFARNLESLLLSAPLGPSPVLGLDPGFRTGIKAAMVGGSGAVLHCETLFATAASAGEKARAKAAFIAMVDRHRPHAIAIGNGTASRETEAFVRDALVGRAPAPFVVSVNEAGASIYSASELAREELPELDLTYRSAVSIARRLQDPLAELVKVDPQALGVGQYQHDVDQKRLGRELDAVVESVVHRVGVDLDTASAALLGHVAGLGPALAKRIVEHREKVGRFRSRKELMKVPGLGAQRFEQAAGFLRIRGGDVALDASAVHPERYGLVETMARDLGMQVRDLVGKSVQVDLARYIGPEVGEPTLRDILAELARPGRDPRESFEAPRFRDDIQALDDLFPGLELDGVVTNVTNFGAFVDIGVHQDGLVHISKLANRFVRDPHEVVSPGMRVRVRVASVDLERKRIALERIDA